MDQYYHLFAILGFILLYWGTNRFIDGSVALARYFTAPPLLIGIVIVGFGTSSPELFVSVMAAFEGTSQISLGTTIGSNITNITLGLGLTAIIIPIKMDKTLGKTELPIWLGLSILAWWLLSDGLHDQWNGILLFGFLPFILILSIRVAMKTKTTPEQAGNAQLVIEMSLTNSIMHLLVGLALLTAGSQLLIESGSFIARSFGISELVIGLTIVAIGTSLPEITASVVGAMKGHHGIATGNIIGSGLFNITAVLGLPAIIHPFRNTEEFFVTDYVITGDFPFMLTLIGILLIICLQPKKNVVISRVVGCGLVISYAFYICFNYLRTYNVEFLTNFSL